MIVIFLLLIYFFFFIIAIIANYLNITDILLQIIYILYISKY